VKHHDQLLPGVHEPLVSEELFHAVQMALKRNSGRSRTLSHRPLREYLLKGLIRCAHCGYPMWAQTYRNGNRYYREEYGSRSAGYCVGRSGSMQCQVPDEQMGRIMQAIVLPDAWYDRLLAKIQLADEVRRVEEERKQVERKLRKLGQVYLNDDRMEYEEYKCQKRALEDRLQPLVVPGVDAATEAGKLLEDLPRLWEEADLTERRKILMTMLEAVYVDTVEEKAIVAIRPKPAFKALFEIATTQEGSNVVLYNENPLGEAFDLEGKSSCFWWRRGRVELYLKRGLNSYLAVLVAARWAGVGSTRSSLSSNPSSVSV